MNCHDMDESNIFYALQSFGQLAKVPVHCTGIIKTENALVNHVITLFLCATVNEDESCDH
jgi:hypothetical protein